MRWSRAREARSRARGPARRRGAPDRALDRALALSPDHLERGRPVPVDELVHRVQRELDREREVLDLVLETRLGDAPGVGQERLAFVALGLVHPDPALDGLGHALGGQAQLEPRAVLDDAAVGGAAYVRDVGRNRVLADLDRRAVEADRGDVVLAAAVGAAGHPHVDLAG